MTYRLPLIAHVLAVAFPAPAPAQTITLEQIGAIYQQKQAVIDTLGVSYTETIRPCIPEAELFREFRMISGPVSRYEAVQHRDGRFFCREDIGAAALDAPLFETLSAEFPELREEPGRLYTDVSFERIGAAMAALEIQRAPRVFVYDGVDLFQYSETEDPVTAGVARPVFIKINPERLQGHFLPRVLWDEVLLCSRIESLPSEQEYRAQQRIPDLFATADFRVKDQTELIGGADCVVVESPSHHRIYLDPALGYAVRRRQWYWNGELAFEVLCNQFTEVAPHVWFPQEVDKTTFGVEGHAPSQYVGKPICRVSAVVGSVEANRPDHLELLTLDPSAGSWVVDETLKPLDEDGNPILFADAGVIPSVSYIVPADNAPAVQRSTGRHWIALIGVVALLGVVFFLLYRRRLAT